MSEDGNESIGIIKEFIAYYIGSMGDYYHRLISSYGFKGQADKIKDLWRKDREQAINTVSDELMNLISINGTKENGMLQLNKFEKNTDSPILMFPFKSPRDLITYTMKSLAPNN